MFNSCAKSISEPSSPQCRATSWEAAVRRPRCHCGRSQPCSLRPPACNRQRPEPCPEQSSTPDECVSSTRCRIKRKATFPVPSVTMYISVPSRGQGLLCHSLSVPIVVGHFELTPTYATAGILDFEARRLYAEGTAGVLAVPCGSSIRNISGSPYRPGTTISFGGSNIYFPVKLIFLRCL